MNVRSWYRLAGWYLRHSSVIAGGLIALVFSITTLAGLQPGGFGAPVWELSEMEALAISVPLIAVIVLTRRGAKRLTRQLVEEVGYGGEGNPVMRSLFPRLGLRRTFILGDVVVLALGVLLLCLALAAQAPGGFVLFLSSWTGLMVIDWSNDVLVTRIRELLHLGHVD